jgi:hypothetical protein
MLDARALGADCQALEKGMDTMLIPNRGRIVAVVSALALAGGLLTLALLAKPTQAQSQGAVVEEFPVDFTLDANECAGEEIQVTGTLRTVNHFTDLGDGQYHINSHFNLAGVKGVGLTTGDTYVVPASGAAVENRVQSGQIVTGTVDINLVVGKGKLPNQVAFARVHFILTPEGEVKMENIQFHFHCQQEPVS